MKVEKRGKPLQVVTMFKASRLGQQSDGVGVLVRLLRSDLVLSGDGSPFGYGDHRRSVILLSLCGCGLTVQRLALVAVGNLAFCLENRRILVTSESLRELLLRLTFTPEPLVNKAAARALAILGENENCIDIPNLERKKNSLRSTWSCSIATLVDTIPNLRKTDHKTLQVKNENEL